MLTLCGASPLLLAVWSYHRSCATSAAAPRCGTPPLTRKDTALYEQNTSHLLRASEEDSIQRLADAASGRAVQPRRHLPPQSSASTTVFSFAGCKDPYLRITAVKRLVTDIHYIPGTASFRFLHLPALRVCASRSCSIYNAAHILEAVRRASYLGMRKMLLRLRACSYRRSLICSN
jgi:hypothetical protein